MNRAFAALRLELDQRDVATVGRALG